MTAILTPGMQAKLERFACNTRRLRIRAGLSQQELAWAVHVDKSSISKIESGRMRPSFQLAVRISRVLDGDLDEMVDEVMP